MFGTLMTDLQRKEPLTFVESTDLASALSRSRRDKPHISCEFCRTRKIRCSGQPNGCDRCVAVSVECRYPGREARRRKRPPSSRQVETSGQSSSASRSSSDLVAEAKELEACQGQGQEWLPQLTSAGVRSAQAGGTIRSNASTAGASCVGMFGLDLEPDYGQQQMEHWLSAYSFLDPMLTAAPLENPNDGGGMEMVDDAMGGGSLLGDADSLNGFEDLDPGTSPSSFPSPDSLAQSLMPSPFDVVSPLALTMPASTHSQPLKSGSNSKNSNTRREQPSSSHAPGLGRWSGQSPATPTPNKVRRTSAPSDRQKTSPTSAARLMAAAQAAAAASSSSSSSSSSSQLASATRGHPAKDSACRCLHLTAILLEELGAKSASSDPAAMDVLLGYFRGALVHCATILDCERCTSLSENNMLLAMAGQYMSIICERIVKCYIGLRRAQDQQQNQNQQQNQHQRSLPSPRAWTTGGGGVSGRGVEEDGNNNSTSGTGTSAGIGGPVPTGGADDMWFSTYHIESGCERMQVLRCLVTVQLAEFSRLLEKLKARPGSRRGHLVLLTEAEKRIKGVRSMLRASLDRP